MNGPVDPLAACAAALAGLPEMNPARLAIALRGRPADEAWDLVTRGWLPPELRPAGGPEALAARWRAHAAAHPPEWVVETCAAIGVRPVLPEAAGLASRLEGLDPPVSVLFAAGDLSAAAYPCVAIVGTRRATALGREIARAFGADLAGAGVAVVSGLASGIDAAAHTGVLSVDGAPPVAVVGSGLDVPYPQANAALWDAVGAAGLLLSEHPPGAPPLAHHFPQRNRIVAGLAKVVLVVESHRVGGALITADLAGGLGRTVGAVPGSLRNAAAQGTNALLRDGALPVLDATDVLIAAGVALPAARRPGDGAAGPDPVEQLVLDVLGDGGTVDELVQRSGAPLAAVVDALDRLDERRIVVPRGAGWYRTVRSARWS